ncbi:MAG: DUF1688 family protein [Pseudomonadota bacterium]|nr:DUF1688 family protein [Pseudomonadota bacterium]
MTDTQPALSLFRPQHVREKAYELLKFATDGKLAHVEAVPDLLETALDKVLETTRENFPDFHIPPYGIWRNYEAGGIDRWGALANARGFETAEEMLAAAADLAILGTYMKTRHPEGWVFEDRMTETEATGQEASALAAFHMFAAGSFSGEMTDPYRVDAQTLVQMDRMELSEGLQWDAREDDDLLEAMQRHLKRFGEALALRPDLFGEGDETRPGRLAVRMAKESDGVVSARDLLDRVLESLCPLWEGGAGDGNMVYGDSFEHYQRGAVSERIVVPFHLAAQEMVYSLIEPLAWAGFEVSGLEALTPPADPAHAALFLDAGVLKIVEPDTALSAEAERDRMVEIRAVALALTDRLAELLRHELKVHQDQLPLTCILEGGTSRAGGIYLQGHPQEAKKLGHFMNPGSVFWLPFGA